MNFKAAFIAFSLVFAPISFAQAAPKATKKIEATKKVDTKKVNVAPNKAGATIQTGTTNAKACDPACDSNQYCLKGQCIDNT